MGKASDRLSDKFRSVAGHNHRHNNTRESGGVTPPGSTIPPTHNATLDSNSNSGGLNEKDGVAWPSTSTSDRSNGSVAGASGGQAVNNTHAQAGPSQSRRSTASPKVKSEAARAGDSSVEPTDGAETATAPKPPMTTRTIQASKRFVVHTKNAICHSWINVLLIFVPIGIAAEAAHLSPTIVFAMNAVAIVPLAGLLSHATESVASRLGDTLGALLNVSFGNAVELIIFIIALVKNEIRIVQASLLGSILANLLLILGMAFLLGGLRYREQIYNSTVTQMSACLLSLSVMSLLLPVRFNHLPSEKHITDFHNYRPLSTLRSEQKRPQRPKPQCWLSAVAQV
jgi:Ca2+:H+ antiporter